jgi:hypothetical protein
MLPLRFELIYREVRVLFTPFSRPFSRRFSRFADTLATNRFCLSAVLGFRLSRMQVSVSVAAPSVDVLTVGTPAFASASDSRALLCCFLR